jgi:hypothetical protein
VSPHGQRCIEPTFLEFHHIQPYAKRGPATVENISLRCRRHNQYEAELVFGPRDVSRMREDFGTSARPAAAHADRPSASRAVNEFGSDLGQRPHILRCLIRTPPPGL